MSAFSRFFHLDSFGVICPYNHCLVCVVTTSPIDPGTCIVFDRFLCLYLCFFLSFFVSLLARLRENRWTDLHEIFREGVE